MYSDMSGEFVTAGKPAIALIDGTSVWSLVDWSFTRSVGILPRPHGHQSDREAALLEHLSQDLVTLGRALVVVRHRGRAGGRPRASGGVTGWPAPSLTGCGGRGRGVTVNECFLFGDHAPLAVSLAKCGGYVTTVTRGRLRLAHGAKWGVSHQGGGVGWGGVGLPRLSSIVQFMDRGHVTLLLQPRGEQVRGVVGRRGHHRGWWHPHIVWCKASHLISSEATEAIWVNKIHPPSSHGVSGEAEDGVRTSASIVKWSGR